MISSPEFEKGAIDMSIDRFIIKKLDNCHEEQTRLNLVKLFCGFRRLKGKRTNTTGLAEARR